MNPNHFTSITGRIYSVDGPKTLPSGTLVTTLRIPVNRRVQNKQTGEWGDEATWYDLPGYGETAEKWANRFQAGDVVNAVGEPRYRAYVPNGSNEPRVQPEIVFASVDFVPFGRKPREGEGQGNSGGNGGQRGGGHYNPDDIDEIPF